VAKTSTAIYSSIDVFINHVSPPNSIAGGSDNDVRLFYPFRIVVLFIMMIKRELSKMRALYGARGSDQMLQLAFNTFVISPKKRRLFVPENNDRWHVRSPSPCSAGASHEMRTSVFHGRLLLIRLEGMFGFQTSIKLSPCRVFSCTTRFDGFRRQCYCSFEI
jgi:hypothetical protein